MKEIEKQARKKTGLGKGNIVDKSTDMGRYRVYIRKSYLVENTKRRENSLLERKQEF